MSREAALVQRPPRPAIRVRIVARTEQVGEKGADCGLEFLNPSLAFCSCAARSQLSQCVNSLARSSVTALALSLRACASSVAMGATRRQCASSGLCRDATFMRCRPLLCLVDDTQHATIPTLCKKRFLTASASLCRNVRLCPSPRISQEYRRRSIQAARVLFRRLRSQRGARR